MRLYKSHKIVAAAVILSVLADEEPIKYVLDDGDTVEHPKGTNYVPFVGDYYVQYEDGYASLSPKAAFEGGYSEYEPQKDIAYVAGLSFGEALDALKRGTRVAREDWRSANSIAVLELCVVEFHAPYFRIGHFEKHNEPLYVMQGPSVEDMTANDWFIPRGDENDDDEPELPLGEPEGECCGKCGACESVKP